LDVEDQLDAIIRNKCACDVENLRAWLGANHIERPRASEEARTGGEADAINN